jgi:hypothetical protein
MEKSSQIAWKLVPLRHFFPLQVVPLIEVLLYELRCWSVGGLEKGVHGRGEVLLSPLQVDTWPIGPVSIQCICV